jgi:hypothetical protein
MQSKKLSIIEVIINTITGLGFSLGIQLTLYPIMGIPVTFNQNLTIACVFFAASIMRSYIIRRIFTKIK